MFAVVTVGINAEEVTDTMTLQDVVVTGARNATDVRYLPMTISVIGRETLTGQYQASVLPTVMQQVPGLFITSRSMLGYGVSGGAAGGINLRGITGGSG
jgi:iron complex outermembrane receptor protein